jgi:hypothetical protein
MEKLQLINGSARCVDMLNFSACPEEPLKMFDVAMTGLISVFLFTSVSGHWLVNNLFRVYNVIRKEASVSHLCLSHMAVSDLVYSVFVTPLTLAVFMSGDRFAIDFMKDGQFKFNVTNAIVQV